MQKWQLIYCKQPTTAGIRNKVGFDSNVGAENKVGHENKVGPEKYGGPREQGGGDFFQQSTDKSHLIGC